MADTSAQVIRELVEEELLGAVVDYRVVPAETDEVMAALIEMADYFAADLIVTIGATGVAPRDIAPEATRQVVDKDVPGIAEAIRAYRMSRSPDALWQRGVAGIRGRTLIVNLPGDPKGVHDGMTAILPQLPAGLAMISGKDPA
jgi:molybdenum cofactor synthesis domain-containing protein